MSTNSQTPYFCSLLSRGAGEKTFATASVGDLWMLVEYPSVWGTRALEDSALPAAVKTHLGSLLKTIPRARLLFIKQGRACSDYFNFFVARTRERGPSIVKFQLRSYEELTEVDVAALAGGETAGGVLTDEPMFLVCTHGRRDKCCAKFGYPLYKALRAREGGAAVWQSSHVGGDRFAANLVCFPHGLFYAHVAEEAGSRIIDEYRARRIVLDHYRGRACYSHPVQAAEFFVRQESGLVGVEEFRHLRTDRAGDRFRRVRFADAGDERLHEATVGWHDSEFRNFITCHAVEERSVPQYALAEYRVRAARTLAQA